MRPRDPPVQGALAGRVFDREQTDAVVPEHRVHAPHGAVWVDRHQQPIQRRHRGDPHPGVARSEHLVHEIVIEPVEDRQIEQAGAIRRRQVAQQPHADVVLGESLRVRTEPLRLVGAHVAIDQQRDGPASREFHHRRQLASRQLPVEEPGDVGGRKPALPHPDDDRLPGEDVRGQIESRIGPDRDGQVEIGRGACQQQIDQLDRAARQAIDLVEHQQARCRVQLDRTGEHPHLVHRRRRGPGIMHIDQREIQAGVLERGREAAPEQVRAHRPRPAKSSRRPAPAPSRRKRRPPARWSCRIRPAARNTVSRRSSNPSMWCSSDA